MSNISQSYVDGLELRIRELAATIGSLTAKLEAERKAREKDKALWADSWATYSREVAAREVAESRLAAVFERTKELAARIAEQHPFMGSQIAAAIRALAPEESAAERK